MRNPPRVATCRICDQFLRAEGGGVLCAGDLAPDHQSASGRKCAGSGSEVRNGPPHRDPQGAPEKGDELPVPGELGSVIQVLDVWESSDGYEVRGKWCYRDGKSETERVTLQQWWTIVGFPHPSGVRLTQSGATLLWAVGNENGIVESLPQLARIMRRLTARVHRSFRQEVARG